MFKTEKLKALVNERLQAAAEEIFNLFEEAVRDYEKEIFRSKEVEQQQRRMAGWKAPQQLSVQEDGAPSEQDHTEKKTDLCEDEEEFQIKEEQGVKLWLAGEKWEEADTKDSMFNIIYVERSEAGKHSPNQCQTEDQTVKQSCDASEPTTECPSSEISNDEQRDSGEIHSGANSQKLQKSGQRVERPYTCSVCKKNLRTKSILTRHMKIHTGEKPHSCSMCGKSFIQRCYLQTHMNSHSGQKPYICSFCGKGFTQVGNLNVHMRIHTDKKSHSCDDCGKKFREKADLTKHAVIHTFEKPYSCTMCDARFNAQSNLTRHMKTHSGVKPYSCTVCGKRFSQRSHQIVHMKTHTGENI
ncbi:zinc finger protein 501-like [Archocentrus centrarchus]|uniref:zinc finger protein 501-like n=1 Tax=Archocentrus centrarchus TaxID=63155 RepID=UPI0011EA29AA|nr:zinc finger protein 501-like [Archocentrus centrarchus]